MTPRDRMIAGLSRERPDTPAVDLGGRVASLCIPAYLALKQHLGFGDALVFYGGLDVQSLLPSGSAREQKDHGSRYYRALVTHRHIMAPANTVQVGTSPENLVAAFDQAARLIP